MVGRGWTDSLGVDRTGLTGGGAENKDPWWALLYAGQRKMHFKASLV